MNKSIFILLIGLLSTPVLNADIYLEIGVEGGGDELIGTSHGDNLYTGGGLKLAGGIQNPIGYHGDSSFRLALGYLSDSVNAINGYAEMETLTFDALYMINEGPHSFGVGPTMHMSPRYRDNVSGFRPVDIEFDDAVGIMLQYGLQLSPSIEVGARLTQIEYENDTTRLDAGSFGIYLSNGF